MAQNDYHDVYVSNVEEFGEDIDTITYFEIKLDEGYVIYQIVDEIYYRPSEEFYKIKEDFATEVPGQTVEALKVDYLNDEPIQSVNVLNNDECMFILSAIFSSLTGDSYDLVNENVKIKRHTSISADNELKNSKLADEAKNGTKD